MTTTPEPDESHYVQPVIGGDGPPIASCLVCGVNGPLATWYGSTRAGVCQGCRDARVKYQELIYEVATKYPGESRHETARRYIREREAPENHTDVRANGWIQG